MWVAGPGHRRSVFGWIGVLACGLLIAISSPALPAAGADPIPDGCQADYSVPNQLTTTCAPGAGVGQHAYIRCADLAGIRHTHIGVTIGREGGGSTAVCAAGETGPV